MMFKIFEGKREIFDFKFKRLLVVGLLVGIILMPTFVSAKDANGTEKLKVIGPCNMSGGTIFKPGKMAVAIKYLSFEKDHLYDGGDEISGIYNGKFNKEEDIIITGIRYGINKKYDIRLSIPYYRKTLKRHCYVNTPKQEVSEISNNGIGDITMMGRYSFLSQRENDPCSLAIGLGVKMPTGDCDKKNPLPFSKKFEYLGPGFQLGTGSWDPKVELGFTKRYLRSRFDSHFMYTWGNEGEHGLEKGDILKYSLGYTYAVSKKYDLQLELNGIKADKSFNNNEIMESSGGSTIFLTPGVHCKMKNNFNISVATPIVVHRDLNADSSNKKYSLGENCRFIVKMAHLF